MKNSKSYLIIKDELLQSSLGKADEYTVVSSCGILEKLLVFQWR
jgi:hypothetical protein